MNWLTLLSNTLFHQTPHSLAIFDQNLRLQQTNTRWSLVAPAAPHTHLWELLPTLRPVLEPLLPHIWSGQSRTIPSFQLQKGDKTLWLITIHPIFEGPTCVGMLHIWQNITPQTQVQEALQTAQDSLLTLMSNLPGMAYRGPHTPQRVMELVNAGAWELTGYSAEAFLGHNGWSYEQIIYEEDRPAVWQTLEQAIQQKQPFELIYRIRTKGEQIKWVQEHGSGIFAHTGELIALEGFITDITERVLSHQLLERRVADRTRKLSALYEVMEVAADQFDLSQILQLSLERVLSAVHGQAGAIHLWNAEEKLLHLTAQVHLPDHLITHWQTHPTPAGLIGYVLETNTPQAIYPLADHPHTEELLQQTPWQVYAGCPMNARGHLVGVLSLWRISPRPYSEEDLALLDSVADQIGVAVENAHLRQQEERLVVLQERQRLARELHDAVTHSLYSLTLFAETAKRFAQATEWDKVQQYLERVKETAQQSLKEMRLLLHNLRPTILEELGLVEALQHRLEAVEKRSGVGYRLIVEGVIELPPAVEEALFFIAEEALNNALKHAGATAVRVTIHQTPAEVLLIISDNGCGFDIPKAWQNGGLGLTHMKERVQLLGGRLLITPAEPCGTKIEVGLPLFTRFLNYELKK